MFRLSELYANILKKPLPTDCGITCEVLDPAMAKLNRLLTDSVSCYSYTLLTAGWQSVEYDGRLTMLRPGDLFISTPGMRVLTRDVSADYSAICLMGDESVTYEISYARNAVRAAYLPAVICSESSIHLSADEAAWLEKRMKEICAYIGHPHVFKTECLYSLYSLFILDLLSIENRIEASIESGSRAIDIFLRFLRLLTENFARHHDIAFYADALAVSTIYLSRIVKRCSGRTVRDHVDRLLLMEACYQLVSTDRPISAIAESLNFANPAGFTRFFTRQKGISPRRYRSTPLISP